MAFYNIPPDASFLDALVAGMLPAASSDPLALTATTILLPTRRAVRSLTEAFLRASAGHALMLPRLVPVGDLDTDDLVFAGDDGTIEIPPALPPLRRELLLARLVLKWGEGTGALNSPGQALPLARELASFLDSVQAARGDLTALKTLAPDKFAVHWQQVIEFLGIVTDHWPSLLAEHGALDPAERRNRALAARIKAWEAAPPQTPVIAAGLSGGVAAVGDLIAAVARLPRGDIVLAGLDLDSASLDAVAADVTHPQHLHGRLLSRFGLIPEQIPSWPGLPDATDSPRRSLVRAALAPARETNRWRETPRIDASAIGDFRRIDCSGAQEEAETIALIMRQTLEMPARTAALVTPDRALARRVAVELKRWNIEVDDSAGVPLDQTPPAVFLRLILEAVETDLAPLPLLALLKHPLAAGGLAPEQFRARARQLERYVLRGPRPRPGIAGLRETVSPDYKGVLDLVSRLDTALAPLSGLLQRPEKSELGTFVAAHVRAAELLATTHDDDGPDNLWREVAGETASQFIAELTEAAADFPALAGRDYPALFRALITGNVVRPRYGLHPRLAIWGLLEARLQRADVMILGGLNEGVWPPQIESDAFLSRPMRQAFGLPAPEERIGVAAHDFAQALGAPTVWLTRAARIEGTPTVPSRWLLRLDTVLLAAGGEPLKRVFSAPTEFLYWRTLLDAAGEHESARPPKPCPPVSARPRRLPVTQIEMLIRDPYSVYARSILRLRPLDAIDEAPDAAARGSFIHDALDQFLRDFPHALPTDALDCIVAIGEAKFTPFSERPDLRAFWWPRFERIAHWVVETERGRRGALASVHSEIEGEISFPAPFAEFVLTAKADRIDRTRAGDLILIDYKTGSLPRTFEWGMGYAPQLPLEAAIAEAGGFPDIAGAVAGLEFWRLSGGDPAGERRPLARNATELRKLIDDALPGIQRLIASYDDPATPYAAVPRSEFAPRYNDYAHLARVTEWAAASEGED